MATLVGKNMHTVAAGGESAEVVSHVPCGERYDTCALVGGDLARRMHCARIATQLGRGSGNPRFARMSRLMARRHSASTASKLVRFLAQASLRLTSLGAPCILFASSWPLAAWTTASSTRSTRYPSKLCRSCCSQKQSYRDGAVAPRDGAPRDIQASLVGALPCPNWQ